MDFFNGITPAGIIGFILLIAGAVVTFASRRIARNMPQKHADMIVKFIGLGVAIVGFLLVMNFSQSAS